MPIRYYFYALISAVILLTIIFGIASLGTFRLI